MKTKLYLEIEGALDVKAFTNKKQVKPVDRVVLLDKKVADKILDIREKWAVLQLVLDGLWKGASELDDREIKTVKQDKILDSLNGMSDDYDEFYNLDD